MRVFFFLSLGLNTLSAVRVFLAPYWIIWPAGLGSKNLNWFHQIGVLQARSAAVAVGRFIGSVDLLLRYPEVNIVCFDLYFQCREGLKIEGCCWIVRRIFLATVRHKLFGNFASFVRIVPSARAEYFQNPHVVSQAMNPSARFQEIFIRRDLSIDYFHPTDYLYVLPIPAPRSYCAKIYLVHAGGRWIRQASFRVGKFCYSNLPCPWGGYRYCFLIKHFLQHRNSHSRLICSNLFFRIFLASCRLPHCVFWEASWVARFHSGHSLIDPRGVVVSLANMAVAAAAAFGLIARFLRIQYRDLCFRGCVWASPAWNADLEARTTVPEVFLRRLHLIFRSGIQPPIFLYLFFRFVRRPDWFGSSTGLSRT